MCENGTSADHLRLSISQASESLALSQRWLQQLGHVADESGRSAASAEISRATLMLGEAQQTLEKAIEHLESHGHEVTVEVV